MAYEWMDLRENLGRKPCSHHQMQDVPHIFPSNAFKHWEMHSLNWRQWEHHRATQGMFHCDVYRRVAIQRTRRYPQELKLSNHQLTISIHQYILAAFTRDLKSGASLSTSISSISRSLWEPNCPVKRFVLRSQNFEHTWFTGWPLHHLRSRSHSELQ